MIDARGRGTCWVVGALLLVTSCTTALHPVPINVVQSGQTQTYKRVLLVTTDGYERRLTDVIVHSDSLVGTRTDSTDQRLAVAVRDIVRLESDVPDVRPAVVAVVEAAAAIVGGIAEGIGMIARCMLFRCR